VPAWSSRKLLQINSLTRCFTGSPVLGHVQKYEPAQGQAIISATSQMGRMISGQYVAKVKFEKGDAIITLGLIKHGDQWQILSFNVDSPALVPH
jgi:hypothetical protein